MITLLQAIGRSAVSAGFFLICLLMLALILYLGWHVKTAIFTNPRYASDVFSPHFAEFESLEARRWHGLGAAPWDCTYAIIGLPETTPAAPPAPIPIDRSHSWQLVWGGENWAATPAAPLGDTTRDAIETCARNWAPDTVKRITAALTEPGSFVIRGPVGETVIIYSKPQRIAARVRYGD